MSSQSHEQVTLPYAMLVVITAVAFFGVLGWQAINWVRPHIAERFTARGASALASLQYADAKRELDAALRLDPHDADARELEIYVTEAPVDPQAVLPFWKARNVSAMLEPLAEVTTRFDDGGKALSVGVRYATKGEYSFARYALEQATTLDPGSPEAWHYLGQTYHELATLDPSYAQKATDAFAKRDALSPIYLKP